MTHGLHRLKDGLAKLVGARGYAYTLSAERCELAWRETCGPFFAARTQVVGLRRKVLEITVANSVALQDLTFRRSELLESMRTRLPEFEFADLRFRIGHVRHDEEIPPAHP